MAQVMEVDEANRFGSPRTASQEQDQEAYERWKQEWDALTDEISAAWDTDKSATQIISEMRR